jgi:hypothetical protein
MEKKEACVMVDDGHSAAATCCCLGEYYRTHARASVALVYTLCCTDVVVVVDILQTFPPPLFSCVDVKQERASTEPKIQ